MCNYNIPGSKALHEYYYFKTINETLNSTWNRLIKVFKLKNERCKVLKVGLYLLNVFVKVLFSLEIISILSVNKHQNRKSGLDCIFRQNYLQNISSLFQPTCLYDVLHHVQAKQVLIYQYIFRKLLCKKYVICKYNYSV